jgi:hypothetical protein
MPDGVERARYRGTGTHLKMRAFPYNSMFPGVGSSVGIISQTCAKRRKNTLKRAWIKPNSSERKATSFNPALSQKVPRRADPLASRHSFMEIRS